MLSACPAAPLYRWKAALKSEDGNPTALALKSCAPKRRRSPKTDPRLVDEIRRLRRLHANLGKDKLHVLLAPWCAQQGLALPDTEGEIIRHYAFGETDLSLIRQRRGDANRLGVAVQLCLLRFPGQGLLPDASMPISLLQWIGRQLRIDPSCWPQYAEREETRRDSYP